MSDHRKRHYASTDFTSNPVLCRWADSTWQRDLSWTELANVGRHGAVLSWSLPSRKERRTASNILVIRLGRTNRHPRCEEFRDFEVDSGSRGGTLKALKQLKQEVPVSAAQKALPRPWGRRPHTGTYGVNAPNWYLSPSLFLKNDSRFDANLVLQRCQPLPTGHSLMVLRAFPHQPGWGNGRRVFGQARRLVPKKRTFTDSAFLCST